MKITIGKLRELIREALGAKTMLPPSDPHGEIDPHELYLTGIKNSDAATRKNRESMDDRYRKDFFQIDWEDSDETDIDWDEDEDVTLRPTSGIRHIGDKKEKEKIAS